MYTHFAVYSHVGLHLQSKSETETLHQDSLSDEEQLQDDNEQYQCLKNDDDRQLNVRLVTDRLWSRHIRFYTGQQYIILLITIDCWLFNERKVTTLRGWVTAHSRPMTCLCCSVNSTPTSSRIASLIIELIFRVFSIIQQCKRSRLQTRLKY